MDSGATVYLVDDDDALRLATGTTLQLAGYKVSDYATAELFLADIDEQAAGCLVTDLMLPGMSGIELQHTLIARKIKLPIIFMTGYGDINESVHAIKAGALDFIEKPVAPAALLRRVEEALALDRLNRESESSHCTLQKRFDELTRREKEVIAQVVMGKTNKVIARELDISFRTVEKHRASAMLKLDLDNVVELATLVQRYLPDVLEASNSHLALK